MQDKLNITFIINPISGGKGKKSTPDEINRFIDLQKFNVNYQYSEYVGHAKELALSAVHNNCDIIVASGGDGTINEVATVVLEHHKILGVLPMGSGNGLARFLNISLNIEKAIQLINKLKIKTIDTAKINDKVFFNIAGIGFDAYLSLKFSKNKGRGLQGYFFDGLKAISNYEAQEYKLIIDGVEINRKAFAISIANSSQYGNNVYISPNASITDGLLDVCIIKPFSLVKLPILAYVMLQNKEVNNTFIEVIKAKKIKIFREKKAAVHVDGEPLIMEEVLNIDVNPLSLQIIVG